MFRRTAAIAAFAATVTTATFLGAVALISPTSAMAVLGGLAAAGFVLAVHLVSRRIEIVSARIDARLTLD